MNEAENSLSRPTKRCRASLPPEERKEYASKRRRHSEIASPSQRKGIVGRRRAIPTLSTATVTQPKPHPKPRKRRDPGPPLIPAFRRVHHTANDENDPSTVTAARPGSSSPFLLAAHKSPNGSGSEPLPRPSLLKITARWTCLKCENANKSEPEILASAPTPLFMVLRQKQVEREKRGITKLNPQARARVINFLVHCQCKLPHPPSPCTLYVSISCFDRFCGLILKRGDSTSREATQRSLSAVAAACLHLASKMEDVWPLDPGDLSLAGCGQFSVQDILIWERRICKVLEYRITAPTPFDFVLQYLNIIYRHESVRFCETCNPIKEEEEGKPIADKAPMLREILADAWQPAQREGRGKCAVEACVIFLLELVLTHPVSTQLTSETLASATVVAVLLVLGSELAVTGLPLDISGVAPANISNVLVVYREYLSAEEDHERQQRARCSALAKAVIPAADNPECASLRARYDSIDKEPNPALRRTRLTAYIINRAEALGLNIAPYLARRTAEMILGNEIDLNPQPAEPEEELEPVNVDQEHPMGLFGADVVAKHVDAANFLRPRFKEWAAAHNLECQTPKNNCSPPGEEKETVRASLSTTASNQTMCASVCN